MRRSSAAGQLLVITTPPTSSKTKTLNSWSSYHQSELNVNTCNVYFVKREVRHQNITATWCRLLHAESETLWLYTDFDVTNLRQMTPDGDTSNNFAADHTQNARQQKNGRYTQDSSFPLCCGNERMLAGLWTATMPQNLPFLPAAADHGDVLRWRWRRWWRRRWRCDDVICWHAQLRTTRTRYTLTSPFSQTSLTLLSLIWSSTHLHSTARPPLARPHDDTTDG